MSSSIDKDSQFATKVIHNSYHSDICADKPVVPPVFLASTYSYKNVAEPAGDFYYSRFGNRSREILEKAIADLEDAEYGLCFSSGMSTIFAVFYLLKPGDHVICSHVLYGGTMNMLKKYTSEQGVEITYVDFTKVDDLKRFVKDNTKMIYGETCCNPLLTVNDVEWLAKEKNNALLVIDNTFITPYFQKPLTLGADIVLHSMTKYMNGHGDVVMGALATRKKDVYEKLKDIQTYLGFVPSPFDCYLVFRGLKTLHLRMREHMRNAMEVAKFLETHPLVVKVLYPGLPSHPQHELAKRQLKGFGGMVSFYIKGARTEVETLLSSLKMIECTGSLGNYSSLISYPATVSHAYLDKEERKVLGITDNFIRLSVGLEDSVDIIKDLQQAFEKLQ